MVQEGYIEKIIFQSEETGYAVFVVDNDSDDTVFVGNVPGVAEGMYIQAEGEFVHHPQYDLQFKIESYELSMPEDEVGIVKFLGSGIVKGIGEALAKRIVKKFGIDTLRIIEEEPLRLAEVRGISDKMARRLADKYNEAVEYRNVVMFLFQYGISIKMGMKIFKEFGDSIYNIVKKNPYSIADRVQGIGFKTVDNIAMQSGIAADSEFRIRSAVLFCLNQAMTDGHIYYPEDILCKEVFTLIHPSGTVVEYNEFEIQMKQILMDLSVKRDIIVKAADSDNKPYDDGSDKKAGENPRRIYLRWNYYMELKSAERLIDLKCDYDYLDVEVEDAISRVEKADKISLAEEQKLAVKNAVASGVSIITGGPGTGKTTIINAIIEYFEFHAAKIMLAAPTGRAAKRITESTGCKAQTIHRLLEFSGEPGENGEKTVLRFNRNESNPLDSDVVIIDEASMVDSSLFFALLKAMVRGTRLVLVGDTDQLPSVGAGNVLHDIIASDIFPVTVLDKIFRQSGDSSIVANAHKIKDGIHLEINNKSTDFFFIPRRSSYDILEECVELLTDNLPKYLKISPLDIEVLTPTRQNDLGVENLNKRLQIACNPKSPEKREKEKGNVIFREGDKVMQVKNNYKLEWKIFSGGPRGSLLDQGVGVFNGDMGIITEINDFEEIVIVTFDDGRVAEYEYSQLDELEHAFAITIHKSQGSEYPAVVIPLHSGHPKLLNRNLLYTAVTRAKQMVVIVGNLAKVNEMIDNIMEQERYTSFTERLCEVAYSSEHAEYLSFFETEGLDLPEELSEELEAEDYEALYEEDEAYHDTDDKEHYDDMEEDYDDMEEDYDDMEEDYDDMEEDYDDMEEDYDDMGEDYDDIDEDSDDTDEE